VGVPEGHPWFGKTDETLYAPLYPAVHGGVTYTGFLFGYPHPILDIFNFPNKPKPTLESAAYWYIGFDCGHAGDYVPGHKALFSQLAGEEAFAVTATAVQLYGEDISNYRTEGFVKRVLCRMAAQHPDA
jgi:hypothetical protein